MTFIQFITAVFIYFSLAVGCGMWLKHIKK